MNECVTTASITTRARISNT